MAPDPGVSVPVNPAVSDTPCDASGHWTVERGSEKTDVGHHLARMEAQFSFLEKSGRVVASFLHGVKKTSLRQMTF